MVKSPVSKYITLLNLYLAQSIPMSFFSTVLPVIMRTEHYSLTSIDDTGYSHRFYTGKQTHLQNQ